MMLSVFYFLLYTVVALLLVTWGGNRFCRAVFSFTGLAAANSPDPQEPVKAGRVIGSLERLITALGLAAGSWEVVAAVIALKTVARFKEIDDKLFAEYFLIGSLSSLLWASAMTGAWVAYDEFLGVNGRDRIAGVMALTEEKEQEAKPSDRPAAAAAPLPAPGPQKKSPPPLKPVPTP